MIQGGGFVCPYCYKLSLCDCSTCKKYYEKQDLLSYKFVKWVGEEVECGYCSKVYTLDQSLDAEYDLYSKKIKK